jgi:hypothetical protein
MSNDCLEILHTDSNVKLLLDRELAKFQSIDSDRGVQWLFKNLWSNESGETFNNEDCSPLPDMIFSV